MRSKSVIIASRSIIRVGFFGKESSSECFEQSPKEIVGIMTHTTAAKTDTNDKAVVEQPPSLTRGAYSPIDNSSAVELEGIELQLPKEAANHPTETELTLVAVETEATTACIESTAPETVYRESSASKLIAFSEKFNRFDACCCAFRCCNCEYPQCLGWKSHEQVACFEKEDYCCKPVCDDDEVWCVLMHDDTDCVATEVPCTVYRQCFCFECIIGYPLADAYRKTGAAHSNFPTRPNRARPAEILPFSACCCMIASLYMRFPGCLCCYEKTTCFCCESESVCFESANCYLVRPKVIFKTVYQVMLLDLRCAIPTDDEIPCVCMPCPFVTCCANGVGRCECCASMETLQGREAEIYV